MTPKFAETHLQNVQAYQKGMISLSEMVQDTALFLLNLSQDLENKEKEARKTEDRLEEIISGEKGEPPYISPSTEGY